MITGLEIPFLIALLYPGLNKYWWYPKIKPDVEKEIEHEPEEMDGVEMWDYHMETAPPVYVNVNNVILPVGGGMSKVKKMLLSKHISKDLDIICSTYIFISMLHNNILMAVVIILSES